jgi:hypothetical protein
VESVLTTVEEMCAEGVVQEPNAQTALAPALRVSAVLVDNLFAEMEYADLAASNAMTVLV